jgi:hypothetical protein
MSFINTNKWLTDISGSAKIVQRKIAKYQMEFTTGFVSFVKVDSIQQEVKYQEVVDCVVQEFVITKDFPQL